MSVVLYFPEFELFFPEVPRKGMYVFLRGNVMPVAGIWDQEEIRQKSIGPFIWIGIRGIQDWEKF